VRYALLGCGRIGIAAALALASRSETRVLTLIDRDPHSVHGLVARLSGSHAELRACAVEEGDPASLRRALEGADALAVAAPWRATRGTLEVAKSLRLPLVSVARPPRRPPLPPNRRAGHALPPALLACGLQPGLTEILALAALASLPAATRLEIRCGCLPAGPLRSSPAAWFGEQPALADRSAFAIRDGLACVVRRFSEVEQVEVEGVGSVEAFHDGMLPWLAEDPRLARVGEVTHKALAPHGFAEAARALQDGAAYEQHPAPPVSPAAAEADEGATVLQVRATVEGSGEQAELSLLERGDPAQGLGSLARTAGFTLACATAMLAEGSIDGHGWLQPEQVFTGPALELLLAELALLGVAVRAERSAAPS
jgi:saccharopine dehydrogenase-like NADP-dependent oxidoreductase